MSSREVTDLETRTVIDHHLDGLDRVAVLAEIRDGLLRSPREISPKYFYDERGSKLFEAICELPEYYPTRTEFSLLAAVAERVAALTGAEELFELGSGAAVKTRLILDAMSRAGQLRLYVPFDFSESTVRCAAAELTARYPELRVHGVVGDFMAHLGRIPAGNRRLVMFLGGTIGNFRPTEAVKFLRRLAVEMDSGEFILLGTDLIKDVRRLEDAYNDAAGVTAEFNRNILRVLNDLLGADFAPSRFEHRSFYNREHHWIEMRLVSSADQCVRLPALDTEIAFRRGEEILTEISAKYDRARVEAMLAASGFRLVEWFTDPENLFALSLARKR